MLANTPLRTRSGQQIVLGSELGEGGEGKVYHVRGNSNLAAKIYHRDKVAKRQAKVEAIVAEQ
jgi:DNA-binding helix-hairpin-helix protein with protein kinase domain